MRRPAIAGAHRSGWPAARVRTEDSGDTTARRIFDLSAQVITYLKLAECPVGLLMNFNATTLKARLKRLEHPELYARKMRHSR